MTESNILFVHGTGVRLRGYRGTFEVAEAAARRAGIQCAFLKCAWGDPLGVEFVGKSVPGRLSEEQIERERQDFAQWSWLIADPLFELDKLTIRDTSVAAQPRLPPGRIPPWLELWNKIESYQSSTELVLLLNRAGLQPVWKEAWNYVTRSDVAKLAFERSAHELPEASNALARALVAQLHVSATSHGQPGPSRALRLSIVERLLNDWGQVVFARSGFFARLFKNVATSALRRHRRDFSDTAALPIGDVLLYQTRGAAIRKFIRDKIAESPLPVTLVAHSLGGIACVDLLAMPDPPRVTGLVTIGSQSPLLYEIGVLTSMQPPADLPQSFPPWLNIFDLNDFLSYVAKPLFERATDLEVDSGQPFPDSHSAYFANDQVWNAVRDFMPK